MTKKDIQTHEYRQRSKKVAEWTQRGVLPKDKVIKMTEKHGEIYKESERQRKRTHT